MKIAILTTYCNRREKLRNLIKSIKNSVDPERFQIDHFILDDGSEKKLGALGRYEQDGYTIFVKHHEERYGRSRHWITMNDLFGMAKGKGYDLLFSLQDDMEVCSRFFERVMFLYEQIPDHSMLMLMLDDRVLKRDKGFTYQIIDGCACVIPAKLMDSIGWEVEPIPSSRTRMSSGVWRQLSYRLVDMNRGSRIYYSNYSLAYHHGNEDSQLNTSSRQRGPIVTQRWIEDETITDADLSVISRWRGIDFDSQAKEVDSSALLVTTEGIGNVIQMIPLYLQMVKKWKKVDVAHHDRFVHSPQMEFLNVITNYFGNKAVEWDDIKPGDYSFQFSRSGRSVPDIPFVFNCAAQARQLGIYNEVGWSVNCCKVHGLHCERPERILQEVLPLDWKEFRGNKFNKNLPSFDIVFCNGSANHNATWLRKKYQHYPEAVMALKDKYSMASVGNPNEYIYGTEDMIHLSFLETLDLISKAKLFVGNDTGLYHFANLIGKRNIVIFTATSTEKNYNPDFHEYARILSVPCPSGGYCQLDDGRLSEGWSKCINWPCAYFEPELLVDAIEMAMEERMLEKIFDEVKL